MTFIILTIIMCIAALISGFIVGGINKRKPAPQRIVQPERRVLRIEERARR